jgi:hypothetical protein
MNKFPTIITKYFRYIFYFLLAVNLLVVNKLMEHGEMLNNSFSPRGVISLELNTSQSNQDSILKTWDSTGKGFIIQGANCEEKNVKLTGTGVAHRQNNWDLLFIITYTMFLLLFCFRLFSFEKGSLNLYLIIGFIIAAGLLDYIEDLFIAAAFQNHIQSFLCIFLPATGKIILLILIVLFLLYQMIVQRVFINAFRDLSRYLTGTLNLIWSFRIPFFCLLILFLALWVMDQGRDLLLIINSYWLGPVSFLSVISILALLNWYLPKLYVPAVNPGFSNRGFFSGRWWAEREMLKSDLDGARLMGSLTFLVPMICILNAMRIFGIPYWLQWLNPFFLLLVILAFYQLALYYNWINIWFAPAGIVNKKRFWIMCTVVVTGLLLVLPFGGLNHPDFLAYLALDLFAFSFVFIVFTTIRTCNWGSSQLKKVIITPYIFWPGVVLLLIFLLANVSPRWFYFDDVYRLLTLPIIICALCFYNILFTYALLQGKIFRIQFISFLFIAGLVVSSLIDNPFHKLHMVHNRYNITTRDSLPVYIRNWLTCRKREIDSFNIATGDSMPIFLINAYGGGIRAAAWPAMVISHLDSVFVNKRIAPFQHYVLSYSGASGGTIGFSVLCAARYCMDTTPSLDKWEMVFKNDFLTPEIIGLFGRDAWSSSFGLNFYDDRSVLQEHEWELRLKEQGIIYDSPFVKYWDEHGVNGLYEVPLLFSNTYLVDSGLKGIVAPVKLNHQNFPGTIFVEDLLTAEKDRDIKFSTASFLSARFPFISPTGKIDKAHHFSDGGFKENSAAETSREILLVLNRTIRQMSKKDTCYGKVRIILISLPNSVKGTDSLETVPNFNELSAPLTALMNNREGNTRTADTTNARDTAGYIRYQYFQLRPVAGCVENFKPILPLGWQISDYALRDMRQSLDSIQPDLKLITDKVIQNSPIR